MYPRGAGGHGWGNEKYDMNPNTAQVSLHLLRPSVIRGIMLLASFSTAMAAHVPLCCLHQTNTASEFYNAPIYTDSMDPGSHQPPSAAQVDALLRAISCPGVAARHQAESAG